MMNYRMSGSESSQSLTHGRSPPFSQRERAPGNGLSFRSDFMREPWGDHRRAAADHYRLHITADQDLAVAIGDRHRIVIAPVAHQRQRTHPGAAHLTGLV